MRHFNPTVQHYKYPSGEKYWLVSCTLPPEGERYRRKHDSEAAALDDRKRLIGLHTTSITIAESDNARAAVLYLKNSNNSDARARTVLDAVKYFCERFYDPDKILPLQTYVDKFLEAKRNENLRKPTITEIERFMGQFANDFKDKNIREFTYEDAEKYITKTYPPNRNRKGTLSQFFAYLTQTAQRTNSRQKVLDSNPFKLLARPLTDESDVSDVKILDVDEVKALLKRAANWNAQRMFVWLLFTGMRPTETVKFWTNPELGWNSINLLRKIILVPPSISKTRTNRKIRIKPNLMAWLRHYKGQSFLTKNWRDKYGWSKDVLSESKRNVPDICRHTFISYLAHVTKEGWVEIEQQAGNTKAIQMKHYLDLVHDKPTRFWAITPKLIGSFDVSETEFAHQGYLRRRTAILKNRLKIRHNRNGKPLTSS